MPDGLSSPARRGTRGKADQLRILADKPVSLPPDLRHALLDAREEIEALLEELERAEARIAELEGEVPAVRDPATFFQESQESRGRSGAYVLGSLRRVSP